MPLRLEQRRITVVVQTMRVMEVQAGSSIVIHRLNLLTRVLEEPVESLRRQAEVVGPAVIGALVAAAVAAEWVRVTEVGTSMVGMQGAVELAVGELAVQAVGVLGAMMTVVPQTMVIQGGVGMRETLAPETMVLAVLERTVVVRLIMMMATMITLLAIRQAGAAVAAG